MGGTPRGKKTNNKGSQRQKKSFGVPLEKAWRTILKEMTRKTCLKRV